ncbi:GNAT family N-acetyltransferase [Stenotrophomonas sp.]|uniref:GNAT family N-acetyltransferase n=1 Tax=Stenotrophomonas sp. TaxID=69392 RepID=UPI00289D6091|nr:GNAT family N-acetyltransferase [Stenotrophomonas sp.]
MDIRPSGTTPELLRHYQSIFAKCFPQATHLDVNYLEWLYARNPAGPVIGLDAWDGERLAAHYACIPAAAIVGGVACKVMLSLNTATDPDYQGRGLFTKLADGTYAAGAAQGMAGIYGVANANSTPGFVRKLGFTLLRPLDAKIGVGELLPEADAATLSEVQFRRDWDRQSLEWRCANPQRRYRVARSGNGRTIALAPTGKPLLSAFGALPTMIEGAEYGPAGFGMRLHLGLVPPALGPLKGTWFELPARLRSSPLNLIYRALDERITAPSPDAVLFSVLDFDAF